MTKALLAAATTLVLAFAVAGAVRPATLDAQQARGADSDRPALNPAPARRADEGAGPFASLVIRNAILIDGTGAPPVGPVDILVEQNRIRSVRSAGVPGLPPRPNRPPEKPDREIDATGLYVMPGFIDNHVHAGEAPKNPDAEYPYKLWMAHGVTTVRGVPHAENALTVREKERSAKNEIVAPRIYNYQRPGNGWGKGAARRRTPRANGCAGHRQTALTA